MRSQRMPNFPNFLCKISFFKVTGKMGNIFEQSYYVFDTVDNLLNRPTKKLKFMMRLQTLMWTY